MKKNKTTISEIKSRKGGIPLVCLTAYTTPFAKILDKYVDILLVGDSLGMVLYGMENTLGVTIDMMCAHGKAVVRGAEKAYVVVDMPFGTYQKSPEQAFENASRILSETGASAVKIEGGTYMAETTKFLNQRGVPVMGHIGLMPQSVNSVGGYRYQGRTIEERKLIMDDAIAIEQAGAFSIVLEGITKSLADDITQRIAIPTIGIGASPSCDGQILVTEDMLGLFGNNVPKFVKLYGKMREKIEEYAKNYSEDVKKSRFPSQENCFELKPANNHEKKKA